jgi:hypothetical protein
MLHQTGLIPCPTLAVLTGFALLYRGFGSGPWAMTLAISGMFYGLFGVFYLNVYLDWILLAGASILLLNTSLSQKEVLLLIIPEDTHYILQHGNVQPLIGFGFLKLYVVNWHAIPMLTCRPANLRLQIMDSPDADHLLYFLISIF